MKIVTSAVTGGDDVTSMPRYFKPWDQGLPVLRTQLKKVDEVPYFARKDKNTLKARMARGGLGRGSAELHAADGAWTAFAGSIRSCQRQDCRNIQGQVSIPPPADPCLRDLLRGSRE